MRARSTLDVEPPPYLAALPVLAAGVAAAGLIVAGVAYPVAAIGWPAAWLTTVAGLRGLTKADPQRPAPWRLSPAWRPYVHRALAASAQYRSMLAALSAGPLQERLAGAAHQVDRGALEVWRQAMIANQLDSLLALRSPEPGAETAAINDARAVRAALDHLDNQLSALIGSVGRFISTQDYGDAQAVAQLANDIDALRGALHELNTPHPQALPAHEPSRFPYRI